MSSVSSLLSAEWQRLRGALQRLDTQTMTVCTLTAFLVVAQYVLGGRDMYYAVVADVLPAAWRGLGAWAWWFGVQGVLGFVVPLAVLRGAFKRSWADMGLGAGNARLAGAGLAVYLPLVAVGTWVLSDGAAFQQQYPHYQPAAHAWDVWLLYEALFLFYWMGWEYLWRGFMIFGTRHTLGAYAIFVQAIPFAALHVQKPWPEAFLSVVGGLALGALVWRCRSFWIAVPLHAAQMMLLDFWCTLRIRSGASGLGLGALMDALQAMSRS